MFAGGVDKGAGMVFNQDMTNHLCPDFEAHSQNAFERAYPKGIEGVEITAEDNERIDAEAEAEYQACEGH